MTRYGSMDHIQQQQRRLNPIHQQRKLSQQPQTVVQHQQSFDDDVSTPTSSQNPDKCDIIPMSMDKPSGLPLNDFLPRKFQNLNLAPQPPPENTSKFSAYKSYCQPNELSEAEVTSSILKGHDSMMAVLANRGRNLEIIQKLWQSKDAKTGDLQFTLALLAVLLMCRISSKTLGLKSHFESRAVVAIQTLRVAI